LPDEQRSAWGGSLGAVFTPLINWLEALPTLAVWRVVILGMALVFLLDYLMAGSGVRLGPFYLLPIWGSVGISAIIPAKGKRSCLD